MTQDQDDQRWLDVLAGRAEPVDADSRQAALLRQLILAERQAAESSENQAAVTRMMYLLEARGAFKAPPQSPGALESLKRWFGFGQAAADGGATGFGGRRAAFAALAVCALAIPIFLAQRPGDNDDPAGIKGLPGQSRKPAAEFRAQVILSAQARQDAEQLVAALARVGVAGRIDEIPAGIQVEALIPAAQLAPAQAELIAIGLVVPADGRLQIRFQPQP